MNKKIPLVVAGVVFTLIALMHVLRLLFHTSITISGELVPMWISWLAIAICLSLAFWMFKASKD